MRPPKYKLASKTIERDELEELADWLRTDPWLTQGPLVAEFEAAWAKWVGTRHAVYVNSGSSANLLMYAAHQASRGRKNNKIVVPAISWATTVAPALQLDFTPLMCDAEEQTFGLDPGRLESLVKKQRPSAVILVHVLGVPALMDEILRLKERYGFLLMEDACAATGASYKGQRVGTFGEMSTFSFFYGHHLSTIEGGMVCTDDPDLDILLRQLRAHGWAKDLPPATEARMAKRHKIIDFNRPFTFYEAGFNVRSTDLNAKIGLSQLKKVDWVLKRRTENHTRYQKRVQDMRGYHCQTNPDAQICSISFAALAKDPKHRARVGAALRSAGVETRPLGGGNMSRQPFWSKRFGSQTFPVGDRIHTTSFQLPNHPHLSLKDVDAICDVVANVRA